MLALTVTALLVGGSVSAPLPPPPFTALVEAESRRIGARVIASYNRCSTANAKTAARYVEAMGTAAHSVEWETAKADLHNVLVECQSNRNAIREQSDFFQRTVLEGGKYDAEIAQRTLGDYVYIVKSNEDRFREWTADYFELNAFGRGRNKDGSDPNGRK
ncbi:MAG: hypothetical protein EOO38_22175 [Cytophagaceae bacterium]|nr:MAG: hypothetical protein EOO38_22175 [Cytophagaceae bacterium]